MHEVNKILVRCSIEFYSKVWKQRNDVLHDPAYYKEYVANWFQKVKQMIEQENRLALKSYLRTQHIDAEKCDASYIKSWILGVIKMRRIVHAEKENDIRQYFCFN